MTTTTSARILQPPTPDILKDDVAHYRFLLELYRRSGSYQQTSTDLTGLTASVPELNTLEGIRLGESVQSQLNSKLQIGAVKTMAYQDSNNVGITGGSLDTVSINNSGATNLSVNFGHIAASNITGGTIDGAIITTPTGSSAVALSNGVINTDISSHGNINAVETTLGSFVVAANTLNINKQFLEIIGFGTFAANANNKQLKLKIGATTVYDSTALALNNSSWKIHCVVIRSAFNSEKVITEVSSDNALLINSVKYLQIAEDLAAAVTIEFTGTGVVSNDIVQEGLIVKYYKG